MDNLRKLAEQFQKQAPGGDAGLAAVQEDDDDDVPELVAGETFEAAAEETKEEEKKTEASYRVFCLCTFKYQTFLLLLFYLANLSCQISICDI